ncbi:transcriptional regulator [Aerococcus urinae]|uniref:transcriptional regulator GutM n=1 Tax=Aerococcus urinae TaxID=1376 RepID=UPI000DCE2CB0|nr:transcriptional regulator GutM [Aerococcus urinae]RAV67842.1 transcriptional regulator [Aerococcus urinae]
MSFMIVFGGMALLAYLGQAFLGFLQIKHFNQVYQDLCKQGKVAIGRRSGKLRQGTIVMFAVNDQARILDAYKMQGVTVLAKFKRLPQYIGQDLYLIDRKHPLVQKENKLTQIAMEDAREVYIRVEIGDYKEEKPQSTFKQLGNFATQMKYTLSNKVKGRG